MRDPDSFFPIRIDTLRAGAPTLFDVFVLVGDHHVHYFLGSDAIDDERLSALKSKGVRKLYVESRNETSFLRYLVNGLDRLRDPSLAIGIRGSIAQDVILTTIENLPHNLESESAYRTTEKQMERVVDFISQEPKGFAAIFEGTRPATDLTEHTLNVLILSLKLACESGVHVTKELMDLGTGALLHDLAAQIDPHGSDADPAHLGRTLQMLEDKAYISGGALTLIENHEERGDRLGYPNKKRLSRLPLTQQILNLCNDFDRTCSQNKRPPADGMKPYFIERVGEFELIHLQKLGQILTSKI